MKSNDKALLGEVLLKRNIITIDQLEKALNIQKKEKRYLGEILVEQGFADEREIVVALVVQCNFAYIAIDKYDIDQSVLRLVSQESVEKFKVIPLDRVGDVLSLVMVNPLDDVAINEVGRITNYKIAPFITSSKEFNNAFKRFYG